MFTRRNRDSPLARTERFGASSMQFERCTVPQLSLQGQLSAEHIRVSRTGALDRSISKPYFFNSDDHAKDVRCASLEWFLQATSQDLSR